MPDAEWEKRMLRDIERILFTEQEISDRIKTMADEIKKEYKDKNPLILCILKGSFIFAADLVRELDFPCAVEFISASSYGNSTVSGEVNVKKDIDFGVEDRHVIIAEDILDTGRTLKHIMDLISAKKPKTLKLCTLLDKPSRRELDIKADIIGFEIPNEFVVGYGLDYAEKYRNLRFIGVLKREIYI